MPFTITVFVNNENVTLSGKLHILTRVTTPSDPCHPTDPCRNVPITIHTNLDSVSGYGQTTGMLYTADGTSALASFLTMPGGLALLGNFRVVPVDPCSPSDPCRSLPVVVTINSQGTIIGATVGGCTTDRCG